MSKKYTNRLKYIPPGYIAKPIVTYPIGQQRGGCTMETQAGGFAFAPIMAGIAAGYAGLKSIQPFSKAKKALEENVSDSGKKSKFYTIPHKISSIGASLGFGDERISPYSQNFPILSQHIRKHKKIGTKGVYGSNITVTPKKKVRLTSRKKTYKKVKK